MKKKKKREILMLIPRENEQQEAKKTFFLQLLLSSGAKNLASKREIDITEKVNQYKQLMPKTSRDLKKKKIKQ